MSNRLADATSPYLLQHKDNPVDWWEWSDEAFAEARSRDVPVFLSVGYAACHWCHVMAHESFEHQPTADYLNEHFVSIKVDREERPDIDAIYMEVTQAMTGHGGWPMTCLLTADKQPFFAGTYFPLEPRQGMPAFLQVLQAVVVAWTDRRDEVTRIGADVASHLRRSAPLPESDSLDVGASAHERLARDFDETYAGFGAAPKFPPSMICEFLLRRAARLANRDHESSSDALRMAGRTLDAMARGGMYDQLGGGFARYSVDERWDVPHFEKMLYDNALLLRVYLHWARQTDEPLAARVASDTADFLLRELRTDEGGFASALDADSEGEEGVFYVWSPQQLAEVLGAEEGRAAAEVFGVRSGGNFERGTSTLRLDADPSDWDRHQRRVRKLLAARSERVRPARDDKVVAAWNGLVIAALAEAAMILDSAGPAGPAGREATGADKATSTSRYLEAALTAGQLLVDVHLDERGRLRRVSRDGVAGTHTGVLEDYACVADAFLTLFGATGDSRWLEHAQRLVSHILDHFSDGEGGFFDTADDAETLLKRPQDATDNATPSGQAMTAAVLLSMHGLTGDEATRQTAELLLRRMSGLAEQAPRFAGQALAVAEALLDGPRQVAVIGPENDRGRQELVEAAYRLARPGVVIAQGRPDHPAVLLLEHRDLVDGRSAAYVCQHFTCELPVTDPAEMR